MKMHKVDKQKALDVSDDRSTKTIKPTRTADTRKKDSFFQAQFTAKYWWMCFVGVSVISFATRFYKLDEPRWVW